MNMEKAYAIKLSTAIMGIREPGGIFPPEIAEDIQQMHGQFAAKNNVILTDDDGTPIFFIRRDRHNQYALIKIDPNLGTAF